MTEGKASRSCSRCGAALPADAPEGLCPRCLMAAALGSDSAAETRTGPGISPGRGEASGSMGLEPGMRLGVYELRRVLGRGGFAEVWEAEDRETGRRLALKVLPPIGDLSAEAVRRFQREGRLAASLNDAHCVYVYSADTIAGRPVIAMELMSGGTLQDLVREKGPLPWRSAVDAILDVVAGLEAAERLGIVHRDVKPSNCFVDEAGGVRIGDFGLSKTLEIDTVLSASGGFLGTPSYASPEQVRGEETDFRSDLYSVGATLYALLSGRPPYTGRTANEVLARILVEDPPALTTGGVAVPRGLEDVVRRAMSRARERRYSTYRELTLALLPFSSHGLTPAGLARRLAAIVIDNILIMFPGILASLTVVGITQWFLRHRLGAMAWGFSVNVLYFWVAEGFWGRSLGKRIMGLRVTAEDDRPATRRQVFVRTFVYCTFGQLAGLPFHLGRYPAIAVDPVAAPSSTAWSLLLGLWSLVHWLPVLTMRRRNGFAGIHELLSGTRVREVTSRESLGVPTRGRVPATPVPDASFGPYQQSGTVWSRPAHALHVAWDPVLRREVWIHEYAPDPSRATPAELSIDSPGRLHWLQGSRGGDAWWDAYEAPTGASLVEWVTQRRRLEWPAMRAVLMGLLDALSAAAPRRGPRSAMELWVDGSGRLRALDFPALLEAPDVYAGWRWPGFEAFEIPQGRWDALVRQAMVLGLEGRLETLPELERSVPATIGGRVPVPVRDFVAGVVGGGATCPSAAAMRDAVRSLPAISGRVSRARRTAALLIGALPTLGTVGIVATSFALVRARPDLLESYQIPEYVRLAQDAGRPASDREAARVLLASAWRTGRTSSTVEALRSTLDDRGRATVEAALHDHPDVTPDQVRLARVQLKSVGPDLAFRGAKLLAALELGMLLPLFMAAPVAIGLSTILRGPLSFAVLEIAVLRDEDGAPASRGRCFGRAVIAWAPALGVVVIVPIAAGVVGLPVAMALPILIFATAAVAAVIDPERGLADRLAGTRLGRR